MSKTLTRCCRKKSRLLKNYKKYPTVIDRVKYKTYRNTLRKRIDWAEDSYYYTKFTQHASDIRMTWKTLNSAKHLSHESSLNICLHADNKEITDPFVIVNKFNKYFF